MVIEKKKGQYWNPILGGGVLWVTEEGGKSQLQTVRSKLVHWMFRELGSGQRQWGPVSCRDYPALTSAHVEPLPHAALGSEVPLQS